VLIVFVVRPSFWIPGSVLVDVHSSIASYEAKFTRGHGRDRVSDIPGPAAAVD
jgi:hypothetical protein